MTPEQKRALFPLRAPRAITTMWAPAVNSFRIACAAWSEYLSSFKYFIGNKTVI
jgi:hypothetical protein